MLAFERFCDHFRAPSKVPTTHAYISSPSNNVFARDLLLKQKAALTSSKGGSHSHVRRALL